MKKAFTLIELLVVIAIIAILAALLIPVLERARQSALKSNDRGNLHHIGVSLAQWRDDNGGEYHKGDSWFWNDSSKYIPGCQTLGWMMDDGYIDDMELLHSPGFDWKEDRVPHLEKSTTYTGSSLRPRGGCKYPIDANRTSRTDPDFINIMVGGVHDVCYVLDEGRMHAQAVPGRVVAANTLKMCTYKGMEPECWTDGVNMLFVDLAVQWEPKVDASKRYTTDVVGDTGNNSGNWYRYAATNGDIWVRYGYFPNPRLDEDECFEDEQDSGEPNYVRTKIIDKDDIYMIEGASAMAPLFEQSAEFGDADPSGDQWRRTPVANMKESYDDTGWFTVAPSCRDGGTIADSEYCNSKSDAAVGGGQLYHQYAGGNLAWRNNRGWYGDTDPNGRSNHNYAGWTFGVPEAYEEDVW